MKENRSVHYWKNDLSALIEARSIAVVGATERPSPAKNTITNLQNMGFKGNIFPVNLKRDSVFGLTCYKSLHKVPSVPDLVVISIPVAHVIETLEQCAEMGVKAVMVYSSGFAEIGGEGKLLQDRMTEICNANEIRLCGPNCLGHLNVTSQTGAYSATVPPGIESGPVAIVSQSGSMAIGMLQTLKDLGISQVISVGNQAVLDISDYLFHLSSDAATKVINIFIEGVGDGRRLMESARECVKNGKVVIAMKVGNSELSQAAVRSHTAAIAGSRVVYDEAMRDCGILPVSDIDEMLQLSKLFIRSEKVRTPGIAFVTISGGQIGMVADIAAAVGADLKFPKFEDGIFKELREKIPSYLNVQNPLDLAGVGTEDYREYADILRLCAKDSGIGMILVSQDAPTGLGENTIAHYKNITKAVTDIFLEGSVPVVLFSNHSTPAEPRIVSDLIEAGVPYLQGARETILAISHFINHSMSVKVLKTAEVSQSERTYDWAGIEKKLHTMKDKNGVGFLSERDSKEIFEMLGLPVKIPLLCRNEEDLTRCAQSVRYPLAMKIESPDIAHKTEIDGVVLNIVGEEKLISEYRKMMENVSRSSPNARIKGVTLQRMAPEGIDLIIGTNTDPQFGPVMLFGLGGIFVEVLKDSSLGLIPLNKSKALSMIGRSKGAPILSKFRGRDALDTDTLANVMVTLSDFAHHFRDEIESIDINPVRIGSSGIDILDALIMFKQKK